MSKSRSAFLLLLSLGLSGCTGQAATEPSYTGTRIHDLQGATPAGDLASPNVGEAISIDAVVTGVFPGLGGYYVQDADSVADQDPTTSEGLFVYCGQVSGCGAVKVGDRVQVSGTVKEFAKGTQLERGDGRKGGRFRSDPARAHHPQFAADRRLGALRGHAPELSAAPDHHR